MYIDYITTRFWSNLARTFRKLSTFNVVGAEAIKAVVAGATEGKSVAELCALGDNTINELLSKVYKGKKMEKGIAFPTCISINNCCGHFSPLKEDSINLKKGDVAKMCDRKLPIAL